MEFLSGFVADAECARVLFGMLMGLAAGALIAGSYTLANAGGRFSKNFAVAVLLLPVIMAVIIPFVATDLKKTLSLAGVFALIRYRSIPGDSKDILYVFFAGAAGLVIGLGEFLIGFAMCLFVGLLFVLLTRLWRTADRQILKITIPEDMNYQGAFDDIFDEYLVKRSVKSVKTSNMGSLFTISYWVQIKAGIDEKALIDKIRTRNGNLNVIIENPDDQQSPVL